MNVLTSESKTYQYFLIENKGTEALPLFNKQKIQIGNLDRLTKVCIFAEAMESTLNILGSKFKNQPDDIVISYDA